MLIIKTSLKSRRKCDELYGQNNGKLFRQRSDSLYHKWAVNYSLGIFGMFPPMHGGAFSANVLGCAAATSITLRASLLCSRGVISLYVTVI